MIYHPQSPFKGTHYSLPVESVDIYPTLLELQNIPPATTESCDQHRGLKCRPLAGQSLAPVILGARPSPSHRLLSKHGVHKCKCNNHIQACSISLYLPPGSHSLSSHISASADLIQELGHYPSTSLCRS